MDFYNEYLKYSLESYAQYTIDAADTDLSKSTLKLTVQSLYSRMAILKSIQNTAIQTLKSKASNHPLVLALIESVEGSHYNISNAFSKEQCSEIKGIICEFKTPNYKKVPAEIANLNFISTKERALECKKRKIEYQIKNTKKFIYYKKKCVHPATESKVLSAIKLNMQKASKQSSPCKSETEVPQIKKKLENKADLSNVCEILAASTPINQNNIN